MSNQAWTKSTEPQDSWHDTYVWQGYMIVVSHLGNHYCYVPNNGYPAEEYKSLAAAKEFCETHHRDNR
jgi:hypothetical protein